jgi:dolichyl-diphosphooligosaccharide--protein glycosyltransferase
MRLRRILFIFFLLLVLDFNLYFRAFPINLPQLKTQAKETIEKSIQQATIQEVQTKFPQFHPAAKDEIVRTRVAEYKKQNKAIIENEIQDLYHQLKNKFQDKSGQTYLMELDCWQWARYVENVLRFGRPGDETIAGKQRDILMTAPLGSELEWDHSLYYFSASLYKGFSFFKNVPLFTFLFYLPLFFTAVFICLLYLFTYRYGGNLAGIISSLFIGLAPTFLQRSHAGWFDRDILNLIFPLLVIWTYASASARASLKQKSLWICFSAFWVGLFSFSWTHWWFIFFIILIYESLYVVSTLFSYFILKRKDMHSLKGHIFSPSLFIAFSLFWVLVLVGNAPLVVLYEQIKLALILNKPLMSSIWPNVFSTVGELRGMTFAEISRTVGNLMFAFSLCALFILAIRAFVSRQYSRFKRSAIMILVIWFWVMIFACTRGARFLVFLYFPLGIALGWAVEETYQYFKNKKNKLAQLAVVVAVTVGLNTFCIKKGNEVAKGIFPLMDDTWHNVLNLIKEKTPPETILNSWWDFGNWFKVVARRRVIFDGHSQGTPQAYWMAKALLSSDEDKSISILRMLNNGGNQAFETIDKQFKNPLFSVLLLESVLGLPPEESQGILLKFLPTETVQEVIALLYARPPQAGFIVDNAMLSKMPAISYLGNWDFSKVYIAQNFDRIEKAQLIEHLIGHLKNLARDESQIQRFYQEIFLISTKKIDDWLSHRLRFYGNVADGREKDGIVFFDNGFVYNLKEKTIQSSAQQIPRSLFTVIDDNIVEIVYPDANSAFSVLVFNTSEGYKSILLDQELGRSIFMRLYFLNGRGLRHFLPFIDAQEGNNYIRYFNIVW